jgi:hypothetical protein
MVASLPLAVARRSQHAPIVIHQQGIQTAAACPPAVPFVGPHRLKRRSQAAHDCSSSRLAMLAFKNLDVREGAEIA